MRIVLVLLVVLSLATARAQTRNVALNLAGPDPNRSVAEGALSALQAARAIDALKVAPTQAWMRQLALQKLGKNRTRRVYLVKFSLNNGKNVQAIVEKNEAPIPEESGLIVYVISKVLQPDGKPTPASAANAQ